MDYLLVIPIALVVVIGAYAGIRISDNRRARDEKLILEFIAQPGHRQPPQPADLGLARSRCKWLYQRVFEDEFIETTNDDNGFYLQLTEAGETRLRQLTSNRRRTALL